MTVFKWLLKINNMKRLFDIVASGCGLLVLSPVLLVVAIWIKVSIQSLFWRFGKQSSKERIAC